ncbi:hypothetical protein LIER_35453 [Lithospermum erythrorhizon]|uniref:Uncharacterized protein n=1 Tax=Lithospermum erythrorhizon TaxID=34254 RepID=A0AAV3NSC7_LITER
MANSSTVPLNEISRDCIDVWVAFYRSLKNKTLVELRACSIAKMGELLTDPIFAIGLVRMKDALEDFFSWVDLLADWHEELHQSQLCHLGDLHTFLTQTSHLRARDQARLEAFHRELVESECLLWSYKETPLSYAAFYTVASRRHLQECIVYALQEPQDLMAAEIHHLEEAIDQAE